NRMRDSSGLKEAPPTPTLSTNSSMLYWRLGRTTSSSAGAVAAVVAGSGVEAGWQATSGRIAASTTANGTGRMAGMWLTPWSEGSMLLRVPHICNRGHGGRPAWRDSVEIARARLQLAQQVAEVLHVAGNQVLHAIDMLPAPANDQQAGPQ